MTSRSHVTPEADLCAYVLELLDEHIAAMQRLRALMRPRAAISPGARYRLALESIRIAQEFSGHLLAALLPSATLPRTAVDPPPGRPHRTKVPRLTPTR